MNSKRMLAILVVAFALMVCWAKISEAGPMGTAWTYQGRLMDANDPADGEYDFEFKLFDDPCTGVQQGSTVVVDNLDVIDGYFTVALDFGSDVFNGDARWLETMVMRADGSDPCTLRPRQELTPTPYALQTKGIFVDNAGNVGMGTSSPGQELHVYQPIRNVYVRAESDGGYAFFQADGTDNSGLRIEENGTLKANVYWNTVSQCLSLAYGNENSLVVKGKNVGIGTENPTRDLHIYRDSGPAQIGIVTADTSTKAQVIFGDSGGNKWTISSDNTDDNKLHFRSGHASGTPRVTLQQDGKVGIGTTNPQADMDVKHSPGSHRVIKATASDGSELFYVAEHQFGNGYLGIMDGAGASKVFITANGNTYFKGGKVGIGTDTPQSKLEVAGWTRTQALEITGGSDLAEPFDIAGEITIEAGMVVSIDPEQPGRLMMSKTAYDRKVAGIVSGAGGIKVGMVMGQKSSEADGSTLIALTGRVYCWADASSAPIEPGDLLTTSDIPGHAMKVNDYTKAQGAILGKAMSSLNKGRGLVLVLVTLQ